MDYVPGKPFSTDNFRSASIDSVGDRDGLAELGVTRTPLRGTIATYLRA
jgi:NADH dehydrogenase